MQTVWTFLVYFGYWGGSSYPPPLAYGPAAAMLQTNLQNM